MTPRRPFRRIGIAEALHLMDNPGLAIFDVRARDAYEASHMAKARHLTVVDLAETIGATQKTQPILIYCYHGYASQEYAQIFSDFGFLEVYSLNGGYEEWRKAPTLAGGGHGGRSRYAGQGVV